MARVYLGLGSNIEPEKNLQLGVCELRRRYGEVELSPTYRSAAVGFTGDAFLNLVVGLDSADSPEQIHQQIEIIHGHAGRQRRVDRNLSRTLDIDLLMVGNLVLDRAGVRLPRPDILEYSFVLRPLAEIAPTLRHPETGRTMAEHWRDFDAESHPLEPVSVIL